MIEINIICGDQKWKEKIRLGSQIKEIINTQTWNIMQKGWINNDAVAQEDMEIITIIPKLKGG